MNWMLPVMAAVTLGIVWAFIDIFEESFPRIFHNLFNLALILFSVSVGFYGNAQIFKGGDKINEFYGSVNILYISGTIFAIIVAFVIARYCFNGIKKAQDKY